MCGSNPELSPEVNSAKCIGGTALGFAIVTLIGFAIVPWGLVSAFAGIFGTIARIKEESFEAFRAAENLPYGSAQGGWV